MSLLLFPDINVWVALNFDRHRHHTSGREWYEAQPEGNRLVFCRQTQLGLFRILTTAAVMGEGVLTQKTCWQLYDRWIATGQVMWADEPGGLESGLRAMTAEVTASPKIWMDAYLAAFTQAANLTLVTFDRALAAKANGAVLLT